MLNQKALDCIFDVNTKIDAKLSRLNQKALDCIFDVNTKIDAKLSRLNQKIDAKLSRHFRDMERVYAVIARAAAKRRQRAARIEQGPHVYLQPRCTPWRTTWNGTASIGPGDSIPA